MRPKFSHRKPTPFDLSESHLRAWILIAFVKCNHHRVAIVMRFYYRPPRAKGSSVIKQNSKMVCVCECVWVMVGSKTFDLQNDFTVAQGSSP